MANEEIRAKAKEKGVFLWEVADRYGVCDTHFCRKLRKEFPAEEKKRILSMIDELAEAKKGA